jgi:Tfp pilus assembly protein PilV
MRTGFSLMEVLLATTILLGSVLVLMELASIGRHYILSVEDRTTAQLLCQTTLNELLAGAQPIEEVEQHALEGYADWVYTVELEPVSNLDLVTLRVTVTQQAPEYEETARRGIPKSCTLVRWIADPNRENPPEPISTFGD